MAGWAGLLSLVLPVLAGCGGGGGGNTADAPVETPAWAAVELLGGATTNVTGNQSSFGFDTPAANLDSAALALVRRFLTNLVPQTFHLSGQQGGAATFRQRFNPFVYSLDIAVPADVAVDPRIVFAAAVMLAAIEGRQS